MMTNYQVLVAQSMLALIKTPNFYRFVDERLFEGLLVECMNEIPSLERALGISPDPSGSGYSLGRRGFPDLVRKSANDDLTVGLEVKLRSQHNLQRRATENPRWQLDDYADRANDTTSLLIIAPPTKAEALQKEFASYERVPFESVDRWKFISTDDLRDAIAIAIQDLDVEPTEGVRLITQLARSTGPVA